MGEVVQLPIDLQKQRQASVLPDQRFARIVDLRQLNKTNWAEVDSRSSKRSSTTSKSTQAAQSLHEIRLDAEPLIDTASFENFITPRIRYTHGFERDGDCILDVPPARSMYFQIHEYKVIFRKLLHLAPRSMLWWNGDPSKGNLHILKYQKRRWRCVASTWLPGKSHPLIGFVYRLPLSSPKSTGPVTLREIIEEVYRSETTQIPTIDDRYRLAYVLATALYQLHCAISSYNILYFPRSLQ